MPLILADHVGVHPVPAAPVLLQLPDQGLRKRAGEHLCAWTHATHMGDHDEAPGLAAPSPGPFGHMGKEFTESRCLHVSLSVPPL